MATDKELQDLVDEGITDVIYTQEETNKLMANKHLEVYGELAVELDALRPDVLEQKIRSAIESELDIDAFNQEVEKNNSELELLGRLKNDVDVFMDSYL